MLFISTVLIILSISLLICSDTLHTEKLSLCLWFTSTNCRTWLQVAEFALFLPLFSQKQTSTLQAFNTSKQNKTKPEVFHVTEVWVNNAAAHPALLLQNHFLQCLRLERTSGESWPNPCCIRAIQNRGAQDHVQTALEDLQRGEWTTSEQAVLGLSPAQQRIAALLVSITNRWAHFWPVCCCSLGSNIML